MIHTFLEKANIYYICGFKDVSYVHNACVQDNGQ